MEQSSQDSQSNFEMSLRDQLIAAQAGSQPQPPDPIQPPSTGPPAYPSNGSPDQTGHSIDPSISGTNNQDYAMTGMGIDEAIAAMANQDRSGAAAAAAASGRELSSSKRAAQNRAAQRAFRQRKEAHIAKLEKDVRDLRVLEADFKMLQQENYQLREYILSLQSRILETSNELPPPPPQVNLQEPGQQAPPPPPEQGFSSESHRAPEQHRVFDQHQDPGLHQSPEHHQGSEPPGQEHDRVSAPTASMARDATNDALPQTAVEQLQAAAAEAGQLGEPIPKGEH